MTKRCFFLSSERWMFSGRPGPRRSPTQASPFFRTAQGLNSVSESHQEPRGFLHRGQPLEAGRFNVLTGLAGPQADESAGRSAFPLGRRYARSRRVSAPDRSRLAPASPIKPARSMEAEDGSRCDTDATCGIVLSTSVQAKMQGPSIMTRWPDWRTVANRGRNEPTSPPALHVMTKWR